VPDGLAEDASMGEEPHSIDKQASLRSRWRLSPAATSSAPAASADADQPHQLEDCGAVSRSSSAVRVLTSTLRARSR
jgi:hypothetical protein